MSEGVHALLLLVVAGALAVMLGATRVVDANIGAGMAMLALAGLGLPWSLVDLMGVWPEYGGDRAEISFFAFCALVNLVLHATVRTAMLRPRQPHRAR